MSLRFRHRADAGRWLAQSLEMYANRPDVLVLALGVPGHEELAMGAIASRGVRVLNDTIVGAYDIRPEEIESVAAAERRELERRERRYRGDRPFPDVTGRTVILVDDGLATGSTMRAAVAALRQKHPARITVAVPVGAPQTCEEFGEE